MDLKTSGGTIKPGGLVLEPFCMDICSHFGGNFVDQYKMISLEMFMHGGNGDTMSAHQMLHGGIAS